jgi:ATP-dependent DNA helicase RecQ
LSCVYRVGERFGARHVIDVLRGGKGQRILELRHNELSTYGIGAEHSSLEWDNIFRQLIHLGYLVQDFTRFGALGLSPAARPVLKGETQVILGMPREAAKVEEKSRRRSGAGEGRHQALFEDLRTVRKRIADAAGVPPFVVFSDATLLEMAQSRPRNERELLSISGVGEHKLRKYGTSFLVTLDAYRSQTAPDGDISNLALTLSDTQRDTLTLYQQGMSLPEMIEGRGLKEATIVAHLEELAAAGLEIDLCRFVAADKVPLIEARLEALGAVNLTALKDGLPESISYTDIRLVRGAWGRNLQS